VVEYGLFRVRRCSGQHRKSLGDGIHTSRKWYVHGLVQEERELAVGPNEQREIKSPDGIVSVILILCPMNSQRHYSTWHYSWDTDKSER